MHKTEDSSANTHSRKERFLKFAAAAAINGTIGVSLIFASACGLTGSAPTPSPSPSPAPSRTPLPTPTPDPAYAYTAEVNGLYGGFIEEIQRNLPLLSAANESAGDAAARAQAAASALDEFRSVYSAVELLHPPACAADYHAELRGAAFIFDESVDQFAFALRYPSFGGATSAAGAVTDAMGKLDELLRNPAPACGGGT